MEEDCKADVFARPTVLLAGFDIGRYLVLALVEARQSRALEVRSIDLEGLRSCMQTWRAWM